MSQGPQQPDPVATPAAMSVWPPMTRQEAKNMLRSWLNEAFAYHNSLAGAMYRESAAKGLGLDPAAYRTPYPGPTVVIAQAPQHPPQMQPQQQQPQQPPPAAPAPRASWLPTLAVAASMLFGGAGAGVLASSFLKGPAPAPAPAAPWPGGAYDVKIKTQDGKLVPLPPVPVDPAKE